MAILWRIHIAFKGGEGLCTKIRAVEAIYGHINIMADALGCFQAHKYYVRKC